MATLLDDLKRAPFTRLDRGSEGGTPAHKYPTPDLGTAIIPKERYTSVDYMKLEWQRMWTKTWMIGGRHEVIPEPGDWMTHEIGAESLVFVRQPDMSIKGFFNVCPHRGNRIVATDSAGSATSFKCGYHHWEWTTNGEGRLVFDEHIDEGIDNALPAFMRLFDGTNDGKMILKIVPGEIQA